MAAPAVLRQRRRQALDRADRAANALAEDYPNVLEEMVALRNARGRDEAHTEVKRVEALAGLLEAVAEATNTEVPEGEPEPVITESSASRGDANSPGPNGGESLEDINGIGPDLADNLRDAGFNSPDDLRDASDDDLLAVDGLGPGTLKKIRENV
jgi:predicted flap endonuclease-1-like 5' DNA nuclease